MKERFHNKVLNQFLSRDAFGTFAYDAGLQIEGEMVFENGHRISGLGNLGLSVCVIRKPEGPIPEPQ